MFRFFLYYNFNNNIMIWFFLGGAADKSGKLKVGDEILSVNNTDCTRMTRLEAWNFMKKLSDGYASLIVRQKLDHGRSPAASGAHSSNHSLPTTMAASTSSNGSLSGNKSDSSLSDSSSEVESTGSGEPTAAPASNGKPSAELTADQPLEGTKVEAKR